MNVIAYPSELTPELNRLLLRDTDRITLARDDGAVLASTRARAAPPQAQRASNALLQVMATPPVPRSFALPAGDGRPARLLVTRSVDGWPVFVAASRPSDVIAQQRQEYLLRCLGLGVPPLTLLALLAMLVWRHHLDLRRKALELEAKVLDRTEALATSEAEFRAIFESPTAGKAQTDLATLRFIRVNERFCDITGYSAAELTGGMTIADLSPPGEREGVIARFRAGIASGSRFDNESRYLRRDGRIVWVHAAAALLPAGRGRPIRAVATVHDITERKLADERQTLLAREVDHRAKTALAVVQAALRLTPKTDAADFARSIEGRVSALARAQTLLANTQWQGADLRALVEGELVAFMAEGGDAPRVTVTGPPLPIPAALSQALSLALHELATNATKHGALSQAGGRVTVAWSLEQGRLRVEWHEQGGPQVRGSPHRNGFGSRLLTSTIRHQLGGSLEQRWRPEGLVCVLDVPLDRVAVEGDVQH